MLFLTLLVALCTLYALYAIGTAIFELVKHSTASQNCHQHKQRGDDGQCLKNRYGRNPEQTQQRQPQAHRLRPLLFVTSTVSLLGFPALFFPPFLCRHFSSLTLASFSLRHFCHCFYLVPSGADESAAVPLITVVLSLLITAFIPLRPLLQRQLATLRMEAVWARLIAVNGKFLYGSLVVTTLFNQFIGLLDKMEQQPNDAQHKALLEEWRLNFTAKLSRQSIKEQRKAFEWNGKKWRHKWRPPKGTIQFSKELLIREVTVAGVEAGGTFQFGDQQQQQRFGVEALNVDFVRDFRVQMNAMGRIVPKSVRQQMPYATSEKSRRYATKRQKRIYEKNGAKTTQKSERLTKKGSTSEERGYATIEGGDGGDNKPKVPLRKNKMAEEQFRPRLPTTPIPRSLPASLLASPCTPLQEQMPIEALASAEVPSSTALTNIGQQQEQEEQAVCEKAPLATPSTRQCWCPLGTECQTMNPSSCTHFYTLIGTAGDKMLANGSKGTDSYEEEAADDEE